MEELKFASEKEALQHLSDITGKTIKIAQGGDSLIYELIDHKDFQKLRDKVDEQTFKLATQVMIKLAKDFTPNQAQKEAINRLKMSLSGHVQGEAMNRNNIFKAAHALGIELPSSMF